jgi:potassium-transporting ATPase KdpC subunit
MLSQVTSALRPAAVMTLGFALVLGAAYPALVTGVAQVAFPHAANGSLVTRDGTVIGSELLAQGFAAPGYFHPRPSAAGSAGYDASASSGSNLGPASAVLAERLAKDTAAPRNETGQKVPADLVTTSASGLDPHISPEAAFYQVDRVAKARGMATDRVAALVRAAVEMPLGGVLGEQRVNVLQLNLALDEAARKGA